MEQLYQKLYKTYVHTLHKLNLGYELDENDVLHMFDLVSVIDYIKMGCFDKSEYSKIIALYT